MFGEIGGLIGEVLPLAALGYLLYIYSGKFKASSPEGQEKLNETIAKNGKWVRPLSIIGIVIFLIQIIIRFTIK